MKVDIAKLPHSLVRLDIQIDLPQSEELWQKAENNVAAKTELPGFRPGKAPIEIVRQKVSGKVFFDEFINLVLPKTFAQAVVENKLETIGKPQIELKGEAINDQGFSYAATVAVVPAVTVPDLETFKKITRDEVKVEDKEINDAINELRELRATEAAVDRGVVAGDMVRLDVQIKKQGIAVEGGEVMNYPCLAGRKQVLVEIDAAIIGMKADDKKNLDIKFPTDYKNKNLAGQVAQADIAVCQVFERILPEVSDKFVKGLGNFNDVADFKKRLTENIEHEKAHQGQQDLENKVFDLLLAESQVADVPETSVALEIDRIMAEIGEDLAHQKATLENYLQHLGITEEKYRENLKSAAEKRARLGFVLRALAKKMDLEITDEEVNQNIKKLAPNLGANEEIDTTAIRNYLLYQKTVKKVLEALVDGPAFLDHNHD